MTRVLPLAVCGVLIACAAAWVTRPIAGVPSGISSDLIRRGCTPLPHPAKGRTNILTDEFMRTGQTSWAVLCRAGDSDLVLVYPDDSGRNAQLAFKVPATPATRDPEYMPTIRAVDADYVRRHSEPANRVALPKLDRPAIEHAFGMGSTILYFDGGEWLRLPGAD